MTVRGSHLSLALGVGLLWGATHAQAFEWGVSKPVPSFDAFWERRPISEPDTLALWSFDERVKEGPDEDLDAALENLAGDAPPDDALSGARQQTPFRPAGETVPAPEGRFGGSLRLAGKGALDAGLDAAGVARERGAITLDSWWFPEPAAGPATLLLLTGTAPQPLQVVREPDGGVVLRLGDEGINHPRPMPEGRWTHLALVLRHGGSASLLVDGLSVDWPAKHAPRMAGFLASHGVGLRVGAERELRQAFAGRLDEFRITARERLFYVCQATDWLDPQAARPLVLDPPWFAKRVPLPLVCSLDGTLAATTVSGAVAVAGTPLPADFQAGVRGQALDLSQAAERRLGLRGAALFPAKEGSVEFWFRPLNWNNFFHGDYQGLDLPWTALFSGPRTLRLALGRNHRDYAANTPWVPFHPGKWTHVVCTWGGGAGRVYLDGRLQDCEQIVLAGPDPKAVGDVPLAFAANRTLIDELRVYPYALTPEEAWNACVRYSADAAQTMRALPYIRLEYAYDYYASNLTVRVGCLPVDSLDPASVALQVRAPDGRTMVLRDDAIRLDASLRGSATARVALGFGTYAVEAVARAADGRELKTVKTVYNRPQPPWWRNELGRTRTVPRPWTPIEAEANTLSVWGRRVRLVNGGLPESLVSAGAETLAAAPRLHGTTGTTPLTFEGRTLHLATVEADRAVWEGTLEAPGMLATVRGELEYDGLIGLTVTLAPQAGAPVELTSLMLDFQLPEATARQLIVNGGGHSFRAAHDIRTIPAGSGRVWDSKDSKPKMQKGVEVGHFCPVIWIGDDDRGLCFFGENDRGWTPDPTQPAQELRREAGRVVYRMNVFTRPVTLAGPRTFAFFIHPTPTKPLPPHWRALNRHAPGQPAANYEVIDAFSGFALTDSPARSAAGLSFAIEPTDWESAAAQAVQLRAKFGRENPVLMYIDYSWPKLGPTMADYAHTLWSAGRMAWTREVEDYMVYWMHAYLERGLLDGIYIDDVSLGANRGLYATAYPMDDGRIQPGFNTMGFRRFLQRLWVLSDQTNQPPRICPHMTYCFEVPALSFCEAAVNGEDRDIVFPAQHRYMDAWSQDELRVMGSAEKWGFATFWKSGLDALKAPRSADTTSWTYWQGRSMFAHLTPHDLVPMWADSAHAACTPSLNAFGLDDPGLRFLPPWKVDGRATLATTAAPPGPVGPAEGLLCMWVKDDRALLMVSNYAKTDSDWVVTVDPVKLFGPGAAVAIREADQALKAPASTAASQTELRATEERLRTGDLGTGVQAADGLLDLDPDNLDGKTPATLEAERLALRVDGARVRLVVRKQDFRLVELARQTPRP